MEHVCTLQKPHLTISDYYIYQCTMGNSGHYYGRENFPAPQIRIPSALPWNIMFKMCKNPRPFPQARERYNNLCVLYL